MGMFTQPLKAGTVLCYSMDKLDTPAISATEVSSITKKTSSLQITIRLLENVFNNSLGENMTKLLFKQHLFPFKAHS